MSEESRTIKPNLKAPAGEDPYLEGQKCGECGAISLKKRMACAACGARDSYAPVKLANKGTLHSYSIIHRAPGIEVPFVSAIADLSGGTIKTNLVGSSRPGEDPARRHRGRLPDRPRKDAEGNEYLTFVSSRRPSD